MKLVHWRLTGAWAVTQFWYNSQCTNNRIMVRCCAVLMCPLNGQSTYIHTYIDYAMNHKNKQIYSNREGANGSHRINDHLRVSTIKTATDKQECLTLARVGQRCQHVCPIVCSTSLSCFNLSVQLQLSWPNLPMGGVHYVWKQCSTVGTGRANVLPDSFTPVEVLHITTCAARWIVLFSVLSVWGCVCQHHNS